MKGMEELYKTYIYLALTLLFMTFAAQPLYGSLDVAKKNNARLQAEEIASVINRLQSLPVDASYTVKLIKECQVAITDKFVTVTVKKQKLDYTSSLIQTPVDVQETDVDCDIAERLKISRNGNSIIIEEGRGA